MKLTTSLLLATALITFSCNNADQPVAKETEKITDTSAAVAPVIEAAPVATPYRKELEYGKIKFTITAPQSATANTFTIAPTGFTLSNDTMRMDCEGTVVQSEVWDLDSDNGPELLVVTRSGENKKGMAYVFSSNNNKSMSAVNLPDFSGDPKKTAGYSGQDEFAFVEGSFVHRFPLFENGKPINKTRQFQYKLKPGEAMKQLRWYKTIEY
jgi:hypothetical protein